MVDQSYVTKNKTKVPVSSLLESLRRLCTEKIPADTNFVFDIMEIKEPFHFRLDATVFQSPP